jgi:hypothetical protein
MDAEPRRGAGARANFLAWNLTPIQPWKNSNRVEALSSNVRNSLMTVLDFDQEPVSPRCVDSSSIACTDDGLKTAVTMSPSR